MTKRIISLILSVLLVLFSFSACSGSGEGKRVTVPLDSEPEYLDPQIVSQRSARNIIANCFETLVTFDANGEIVPAACESYDISSDGLVYTFKLRKDGCWLVTRYATKTLEKYYAETAVKGAAVKTVKDFDKRLKASDFVFAFERALMPETKCPYASSLMNIKNAAKVNSGKASAKKLGVEAVDEYTLVITLEKKDEDFLSALTMPACAPCNEEFFKSTRGHYGLSVDYLIYNGPFYISNWAEKTSISARKNNSYRNIENAEETTAVKPSSVYFSFNNEQSTRDKKLKDGTYAVAPLTSSQASDEKIASVQFFSGMTSLVFNLSDELLSNLNIRKAIAATFDSSDLVEKLGKSRAEGIIPSACRLGNKSYRELAGNIQTDSVSEKTAVKLLKSGLNKLEKNNIELVILCSEENENSVRNIMQKWQSVFGAVFGISVDAVDSVTLETRIAAGDYQLALCDIKYSDNTAVNAVSCFSSDSRNNVVGLSSKAYDRILSKISVASTQNARMKAIKNAEQYLVGKCIIVPVCESQIYYGISKGVTGVVFTPTGDVAYYKDVLIK